MRFTARAARQVAELDAHYRRLARPEAVSKLHSSLLAAIEGLAACRLRTFPAPRPYPELARTGESWVKVGRYWICYAAQDDEIRAVFFETADIPARR